MYRDRPYELSRMANPNNLNGYNPSQAQIISGGSLRPKSRPDLHKIQSASPEALGTMVPTILKEFDRGYSSQEQKKIISVLRQQIPDIFEYPAGVADSSGAEQWITDNFYEGSPRNIPRYRPTAWNDPDPDDLVSAEYGDLLVPKNRHTRGESHYPNRDYPVFAYRHRQNKRIPEHHKIENPDEVRLLADIMIQRIRGILMLDRGAQAITQLLNNIRSSIGLAQALDIFSGLDEDLDYSAEPIIDIQPTASQDRVHFILMLFRMHGLNVTKANEKTYEIHSGEELIFRLRHVYRMVRSKHDDSDDTSWRAQKRKERRERRKQIKNTGIIVSCNAQNRTLTHAILRDARDVLEMCSDPGKVLTRLKKTISSDAPEILKGVFHASVSGKPGKKLRHALHVSPESVKYVLDHCR